MSYMLPSNRKQKSNVGFFEAASRSCARRAKAYVEKSRGIPPDFRGRYLLLIPDRSLVPVTSHTSPLIETADIIEVCVSVGPLLLALHRCAHALTVRTHVAPPSSTGDR